MAPLSFLLQCAALAAVTGGTSALVALPLLALSRRMPAGLGADVAVVAGVLPALAALALLSAVALPSLAGALGLAEDHCPSHGHHAHLCFVHFDGLNPKLAALGAVALAVFAFRAVALMGRGFAARAQLARLERLGVTQAGAFPIVVLPGASHLCHAAGPWRRRILLSRSLAAALENAELRSALAHETAHLRRRDPLLRLVLSVAGLFAPPPFARAVRSAYQAAAEEACDAFAAHEVADGPLVAGALVKVASLQRGAALPSAVPAFGASDLERRVTLLLEGQQRAPGPSRALACLGGLSLLVLLTASSHSGTIHHAVETALAHVL